MLHGRNCLVVYGTLIFQGNIKKGTFVLADIKRGIREPTNCKSICFINEVDEDKEEEIFQGFKCSNNRSKE